MTTLYVKTSSNLLTSFESMPDSFSTGPEGKIPTSRQVFKLYSRYITPCSLNGFGGFMVIYYEQRERI